MTLASMLVLGLLLGMKHATEADHVAAVATLATRSSSLAQSVRLGIAWGFGHSVTLALVGGAILMLGLGVPRQAAQFLELAVGVMLVLLGADVLRRLHRDRIHFHRHSHGNGEAHFHAHSHRSEKRPHDPARHEHAHARSLPVRAVLVGMMHGMAGSAALILLSLEAVKSPARGIAYIAVFGAGSIIGMAALSLAIAVPMRLSASRIGRAHAGVSALVGGGTVGLGLFIVYSIGVTGGLFAALK